MLCAVEVPTIYPVSLPLDKVANDEWMGRIASDVLVRGTHWAIGCCVLYSLRVLSLAVVSVTLLPFFVRFIFYLSIPCSHLTYILFV